MRGDSSVAGEGRVVCVPKFHSMGKCTMPLTNINSDCIFNASFGLHIIGASLSKAYTIVTALHTRVCMLGLTTYKKLNLRIYEKLYVHVQMAGLNAKIMESSP